MEAARGALDAVVQRRHAADPQKPKHVGQIAYVTDGVLGASWLPTDGYLDPSQLTYALADGARAEARKLKAECTVISVPGALEIPLALQWMAQSGRFDALSGRYIHAEHDPPEELERRMKKAKVYNAETVYEYWPEVRDRVLNDREAAFLKDVVSIAKVR